MSKESVDKSVNAKDQGTAQEAPRVQAPNRTSLNTVGGYIEAKKNEKGEYEATLNIDFGKGKQTFEIQQDTAVELARAAGTQEISTSNGGMIVPLNQNAVAEIIYRASPNADLKSINIDLNSHATGAVNDDDGDGRPPYTVNLLAPATVTDWESSTPSDRKQGKVTTGPKSNKGVKPNDTGKGGTGTAKDKGASTEGTGEGANFHIGGTGLGNGEGNGYSEGNGNGDGVVSRSNNNVKQSTVQIDAGVTLDDKTAASTYAYNLQAGAINHIFHNNYYRKEPVPAWAFSVDFVPLCMKDKRFAKMFTFEDSKTLSKAVLNITANEKTINTQSINYLGLQHPFFTKLAQSHGDLKITFAEDELFSISVILKNVMKYASFLPNFPTNKVYELKDSWTGEIVAHNASDTIAPRYRLNATNLKISDENTEALVHDYKFVFDVLLKIYRAGDTHLFADEAAPPGFVYHFHKCWLKNVGGIELNYDDDKPIDRPVIFSYQYMSGAPYSEFLTRNRVISDKERLDEAYDEAAQQAAEAAAETVMEAKEYSKNSPSSFTDNGDSVSTKLDELLTDVRGDQKLKYLFGNK